MISLRDFGVTDFCLSVISGLSLCLSPLPQGLAAQAEDSGIPTVEDTLFRCMERACLIPNRHAW